MLLGLSQIIDCPGASVSFSTSLDFRDLRFGSSYPVQEPVLATGTVRNTAGVLILEGKLTTRLHGVCDRCAREFQRDVEFPISAVLVTELADELKAAGMEIPCGILTIDELVAALEPLLKRKEA